MEDDTQQRCGGSEEQRWVKKAERRTATLKRN